MRKLDRTTLIVLVATLISSVLSRGAIAQDSDTIEPVSLHPTLTNLSIEWPVVADPTAKVSLRYRPLTTSSSSNQPGTEWRQGMDLIFVPAGSRSGHDWKARYAGSIFGLRPATRYEIELTGHDKVQTFTAQTRAWPVSPTKGQLVNPQTIGAAIKGLSPGSVLVLTDGNYEAIRIETDGTSNSPVVIRAQNPGGAIVNEEVRMDGQQHVHVVGLTVNGKIKFNNASGIVVRQCTVNTTRDGIVSYGEHSQRSIIIGNTITGATNWNEPAIGAKGNNIGEGIVLTGPGHVIAFNRVTKFRDGISLTEDEFAYNQQSIDIFGNEIDTCADDGVEADFAMGNVRVYNNRLTNCFMGISSQPGLGGPTYFVRNAMFNIVLSPFKLQRSSVGDIGLHNTAIKTGCAFGIFTHDRFERTYFRNNLFLGGPAGECNGYDTGDGRAVYLAAAAESCDFDYNGYGNHPDKDIRGRVGDTTFEGEQEMRILAEQHSIAITIDEFNTVFEFPSDPLKIYPAQTLTLNPKAKAVDRGLRIAGINDNFQGHGPDLGAYEVDQPTLNYGPDALSEWLSENEIE